MRIRTITCHDVANYGASLQALALQTYLTSLGHDVKIIDYLPEYCKPYNIFNISKESLIYKISKYIPVFRYVGVIRNIYRYYPTRKRKKVFREFKNKYLHLTQHFSTYNELISNPPHADIYIAGSDQIWRTNINNGKDPAYYLQFGESKIKRVSYAASFGIPIITDGCEHLIKTYLESFDAISVRETSGIKILESLNIKGTNVLDPVFLLSSTEWLCLLGKFKYKISEPYILVYDLNHCNKRMPEFTSYYAKKNNLRIVAINDKRKTSYADININDAGPEDFVSLISNAKMVVTDSFHATAISTIMHTPFCVYFELLQAARIKDFLTMIKHEKNLNPSIQSDIYMDWNLIDDILSEKICHSKKFLKDNL